MSDLNDLISRLPIDDLAAQLGADPADVRAAAEQVVPTLVAGVAAKSDRGEDVDTALAAQDSTLADGTINAGDVDVAQGEQLVQSLFGNDGGDVAQAVSGAVPVAGVDQSLVKKLLPLLAPIVLSYVLGKMGLRRRPRRCSRQHPRRRRRRRREQGRRDRPRQCPGQRARRREQGRRGQPARRNPRQHPRREVSPLLETPARTPNDR